METVHRWSKYTSYTPSKYTAHTLNIRSILFVYFGTTPSTRTVLAVPTDEYCQYSTVSEAQNPGIYYIPVRTAQQQRYNIPRPPVVLYCTPKYTASIRLTTLSAVHNLEIKCCEYYSLLLILVTTTAAVVGAVSRAQSPNTARATVYIAASTYHK